MLFLVRKKPTYAQLKKFNVTIQLQPTVKTFPMKLVGCKCNTAQIQVNQTFRRNTTQKSKSRIGGKSTAYE